MPNATKTCSRLFNVQIMSALIWAAVIFGCSTISKDPIIFNFLIVGAGIHVVVLSFHANIQASQLRIHDKKHIS